MEGGTPVSSSTSSLFFVPRQPSTDLRSSLVQAHLAERNEAWGAASSTSQSVHAAADSGHSSSSKRNAGQQPGDPSARHAINGSDSGTGSPLLFNGKTGKSARAVSSGEERQDKKSTRDSRPQEGAESVQGQDGVGATLQGAEGVVEDLNPLAYVLEKRK